VDNHRKTRPKSFPRLGADKKLLIAIFIGLVKTNDRAICRRLAGQTPTPAGGRLDAE
jgi:hypothetical protein